MRRILYILILCMTNIYSSDECLQKINDSSFHLSSINNVLGFVYLADYGPIQWPEGTRQVRSCLTRQDGWTQIVERNNMGTVLSIYEGSMESSRFRNIIITDLPSSQTNRPQQNDSETIREDHSGYLSVCVSVPSEDDRFWTGEATDLSIPLQGAIVEMWKMVQTLSQITSPEAVAWLVAERLSPDIIKEKVLAGVVKYISNGNHSDSCLLNKAFWHPFQLIPVRDGENPFITLGWSGYTPDRSSVIFGRYDHVYFVRTFRNAAR